MASIPTQEEFLDTTRKSQEAMIAVIKSWLETVRTATPKLTSVYAPLTDKLPRLPSVSLPFADKLPTPEEAVANAYNTAEQLLASQRRFTEELLKAMTPLMPGRGESSAKSEPEVPSRSAWRDAVATTEPAAAQTAPARPAAQTVPARPAAQETPSLPKLRTSAAKPVTGGATSKSTPAASSRKSTTGSSARKSTPAKTAATPTPAKASPAPEGPEAS